MQINTRNRRSRPIQIYATDNSTLKIDFIFPSLNYIVVSTFDILFAYIDDDERKKGQIDIFVYWREIKNVPLMLSLEFYWNSPGNRPNSSECDW